jgi:hypothetical protein
MNHCMECGREIAADLCRCNICLARFGSMSYQEICAMDDEAYYERLGEEDEA